MSDQPTNPQDAANQIVQNVQTITNDVAKATSAISSANAWTAVVGFFTALPAIMRVVEGFWKWWVGFSGDNPQARIADLGEAFTLLTTAKTTQEKQNAAAKISGLITKLPPH